MSAADDAVYLRHILDAIQAASGYVRGLRREAFLTDPKTQDAVIRQLEIIGEASNHVSTELRAAHAEIPWSDVVSMRNRLIHEYFGVDLEVVWKTLQDDLPDFAVKLSRLIP